MSRLSCVQNFLCPDYRAFKIAYVQTIVRSKLHMSRLSCVQNCICPDYRAFIFFPDRVILNARRHLVRSFRSGHIDFRSGTSTWAGWGGRQVERTRWEQCVHNRIVLKNEKVHVWPMVSTAVWSRVCLVLPTFWTKSVQSVQWSRQRSAWWSGPRSDLVSVRSGHRSGQSLFTLTNGGKFIFGLAKGSQSLFGLANN